jgi:hypothetical protein
MHLVQPFRCSQFFFSLLQRRSGTLFEADHPTANDDPPVFHSSYSLACSRKDYLSFELTIVR